MTYLQSPIGWLEICTCSEGVTGVSTVSTKKKEYFGPYVQQAKKELEEFFEGKRQTFDVPLFLDGTSFQKKVWKELQKVKSGKTCSYADLAKKAGHERAARAVGSAMRKNPIPIIIPCHRVVPSSQKSIGNYSLGKEKKTWLLEHEGFLTKQ